VNSTLGLHRCTLHFFGHSFAYLSAAKSDIGHLELVFREFVVAPDLSTHPECVFLMSEDASDPYIRGVFDPLWGTKQIYYQLNNNNAWVKWTLDDTPIPPFSIPPLAHKFLVLHGCSVWINGRAIAFCGASFAGKSSLLLEVIHQGGHAISDDLVLIEFAPEGEPWVWRYPKPVGVRMPTLSLLPWLPEKFHSIPDNCKLSFPSQEGRPATTITHLSDIFWREVFVDAQKQKLDAIYFLDRDFSGVRPLTAAQGLACLLSNTCNSGFSRIEMANLSAHLVDQVRVQELGNRDVPAAARFLLSDSDI